MLCSREIDVDRWLISENLLAAIKNIKKGTNYNI